MFHKTLSLDYVLNLLEVQKNVSSHVDKDVLMAPVAKASFVAEVLRAVYQAVSAAYHDLF
uniref:hypothetical protein n=1 Tax=Pedobacter schmidteae TaxID=2201271 RepID=UPI0013CE75FA|nr:hypothetical protein [Pedobacter schmidteae]